MDFDPILFLSNFTSDNVNFDNNIIYSTMCHVRSRASSVIIISIVTIFACALYSLIHFFNNYTSVFAQIIMSPDTFQQGQMQEDVDGGRSEDSGQNIPALESSFGVISINRLVQNVNYSHFLPLSNSQGNQVKVIVDYSTISPSIIGQPINAVMEIYSLDNRSLVRTSSFPDPIIANDTGTIQLATTFTDRTLTDVIAIITFTDDSKLVPISDSIQLLLRFGESSSASS
jgi:hypothetical protein